MNLLRLFAALNPSDRRLLHDGTRNSDRKRANDRRCTKRNWDKEHAKRRRKLAAASRKRNRGLR